MHLFITIYEISLKLTVQNIKQESIKNEAGDEAGLFDIDGRFFPNFQNLMAQVLRYITNFCCEGKVVRCLTKYHAMKTRHLLKSTTTLRCIG